VPAAQLQTVAAQHRHKTRRERQAAKSPKPACSPHATTLITPFTARLHIFFVVVLFVQPHSKFQASAHSKKLKVQAQAPE
jgi:hypothetical protein